MRDTETRTAENQFPDLGYKLPSIEGFSDTSWSNDVCASMESHDGSIRLWFDYADGMMRESGSPYAFRISVGELEVFKTNDLSELKREALDLLHASKRDRAFNFKMTDALHLPPELTKLLDSDCDSTDWLGAVLLVHGCHGDNSNPRLRNCSVATRIELEYAALQVSRATGNSFLGVMRHINKAAKLLAKEVNVTKMLVK